MTPENGTPMTFSETMPRTRRTRWAAILLASVLAAAGATLAVPAIAASSEATIFTTETPALPADSDSAAVELGVTFVPAVNGTVTGVRFWKGSGNTGTHTGTMWSSSGARLATATFSGESASGWQTVRFSSPVAVTKGSRYVASYYAPRGHYAVTESAFTKATVRGDLTVPANGGVYAYGASSFPKNSYFASNYFVDVLFAAQGAPVTPTPTPTASSTPTPTPTASPTPTSSPSPTPTAPPASFTPGNPSGAVAVPAGMGLEDVSKPTTVVGTGTAASCTSAAVVAAVAAGGVVTFNCGSSPVTIAMSQTLKIRNTTKTLVIDGGGLVTLSGGDARRILYIDTCDTSLGSVSGNCLYAPDYPRVTVQNITLADGNATNETYVSPGDTDNGSNGGGAIFALGGHLKVVNSIFTGNTCASNGPDLGGGAIRVLAQHSPTPNNLDSSMAALSQDPVAIVGSTFRGNDCSNGGAVSGLRTPITVVNSLITGNAAVGCCSNPAKAGTPGGGSGGAIYTDGGTYDVRIAGSRIEGNTAKAGGSAIFYVSNTRTGRLYIDSTVSTGNTYAASGQSTPQSFQNYPGIFYLGNGEPVFTNSTIK